MVPSWLLSGTLNGFDDVCWVGYLVSSKRFDGSGRWFMLVWSIMTLMALASWVADLNATAVTATTRLIINDLRASEGCVWIDNFYLITSTAFTPISSQTANVFSHRSVNGIVKCMLAIAVKTIYTKQCSKMIAWTPNVK